MNLSRLDFERVFSISEMFSDYQFYNLKSSHDLYFFGVKRGGVSPAFDKSLIAQSVAKLETIRTRTAARRVMRTPLDVLSYCLSDRHYQNIAVPYTKALYRFTHAVGLG
jgi:hypothetical protein